MSIFRKNPKHMLRLGRTAVKLKLIAAGLGFICVFSVFEFFGSALQFKDEEKEKYSIRYQADSPAENMLAAIENKDTDDIDHGQFMLTDEDMTTLLKAVIDTQNDSVQTDFVYAHYWEAWCVLSWTERWYNPNYYDPSTDTMGGYVVSEFKTDAYQIIEKHVGGNILDVEWGWKWGYRWSDNSDNSDLANDLDYHYETDNTAEYFDVGPQTVMLNNDDEFTGKYALNWQTIYCLAVMASQENEHNWHDGKDENGDFEIVYRLDEETLHEIIDAFKFDYEYAFDGAREENMKEAGKEWREQSMDDFTIVTNLNALVNLNKEGPITVYVRSKDPEDTNLYLAKLDGNNFHVQMPVSYMYVQEKRLKWNPLERYTYVVNSSEDEGAEGVGLVPWAWVAPASEETIHTRYLKKIPVSSLLSVHNSFMAEYYRAPETTVGDTWSKNKYKYYEKGVENGETKLNANCKYQNNKQYDTGFFEADPQLFYATCRKLVDQFDWEYFLMMLEALPDTEEIIETYEEMYKSWKEGDYIYRELEESGEYGNEYVKTYRAKTKNGEVDYPVDLRDIVFGSRRGDFSDEEGYVVPDLSSYSGDADATRSLLISDNLTEEQLTLLLSSYPAIARKSDSLFLDSTVVPWLLQFQDDYPDASLLGLIGIAGTESAWGTSSLCHDFWDFIGWGAFDNSVREGVYKYGNFKKDASCVGEALYNNFRKIYLNYFKGQYNQDSYYKMRFNDGRHQYCTSTTWPVTNAKNRASMEEFLLSNLPVPGGTSKVCTGFVYPLAVRATISSHFGKRDLALAGSSKDHGGIDLACARGTAIYAAGDGVVSKKGVLSGYGNAVYINHANGVTTRYAHMNEPACVVEGEHVTAGDLIGYVGSTGVSSGYHLHFEIRINGEAVDPEDYMHF